MPFVPIILITNTEFLTRFDWRWVAQNIVEGATITGAATPPTLSDLQNPASASGAVLEQLIADASDVVMSAIRVGDRYSVDDIVVQGLGGNLIKQITAGVTVGGILRRRVRAVSDETSFNLAYSEAMDYLQQLRQGERIFYAVPEVPEAGVPGTAGMIALPGFGPPFISQNGRIFGNTTANQRWPWGGGGGF